MADINNGTSCQSFTTNQCATLMILLQVIIFIICVFREYKFFVLRLLLFLSISSTFQSISYLITNLNASKTSCQFQAFTMQYFLWSTLLWVIAITIHVLCSIKKKSIEKYEKYLHLVSWLFPFFWALLPLSGNSYDRAGVWCWIKRDATALRFGTWFVPKFIVILFLVISYFYILFKAMQQRNEWSGVYTSEQEAIQRNSFLLKEVKQLAIHPIIYLLVSLPSFILRIEDALHSEDHPKYYMIILHVIFSPANGAVNAVAFAFYGNVQKKLTLPQLKMGILSWFRPKAPTVIHNYVVDDSVYTIPSKYNEGCDM